MSKISDKLNIISSAKDDIKTAIENKGVTVGNIGIQEYASKINEMEVATPVEKGFVVNEWDSDGYATSISIIGFSEIPDFYFFDAGKGSNPYKALFHKITKNITFPQNLNTIGVSAFYGWTNLALTELPDSITKIGNSCFWNCSNLALTKLPNNISILEAGAFNGCKNITITELPDTLTSIEKSCFDGCNKITTIKWAKNIETIAYQLFYNCTGLTSITQLEKVKTLEYGVFYGCKKLAEIYLPVVTSIANNVFYNCSLLKKVVMSDITSVPTLGTSVFNGTPIKSGTGYIYVPDDLVDSFKSATNWSAYADQIKGVSELV